MKLFDKLWNALGLVEAEETDEQPAKPVEKSTPRQDRKSERSAKPTEDSKPRWSAPPEPQLTAPVLPQPPYKSPHPSPAVVTATTGKNKLVLTQPNGFDDAQQIAENVTNGKTVLVNFDRTDAETTKRTIDFMSGITYAVGGTVQRISAAIFLFAPSDVLVYSNERPFEQDQAMLPWRGQRQGRDH